MGCFLSDGACDVTCSDHSDNKAECKALGCTYDDSKAATCDGDNPCEIIMTVKEKEMEIVEIVVIKEVIVDLVNLVFLFLLFLL